LTELAKLTLELTRSLHTKTLLPVASLVWELLYKSNPSPLPSMPKLGNSTLEVSSALLHADLLLITESWSSPTLPTLLVPQTLTFGLSRTLGELTGETTVSFISNPETLADLAMLPHTPLHEKLLIKKLFD